MISLYDLIFEESDDSPEDGENREIWQTDVRKWAGRNSYGQVRYFKDREKAVKFARGELKGPPPEQKEKYSGTKRKEKIQKYINYDKD